MENFEAILSDREARNLSIIKAAEQSDIITVKANVPGTDKKVKESFLLVRYFTNQVLNVFGGEARLFCGSDGMYSVVKVRGSNLKERTVEIEKSHPIGRFCDIDVYLKGSKNSLSRGYMRRCFICQNPAFICARQGNHTARELLAVLKSGVREHFSALLFQTVKQSLMAELNLENKFGLVTPTSSGSHTDLNYAVMQISQNAIIPYLVNAFWVGFDSNQTEGLLAKLRPVGIKAEKAMFDAVKTNTYKGFIFVAGILLASLGHVLSQGVGDFDTVFTTAAKVCSGICGELEQGTNQSFGITAYKNYKITGVRGHAEQGFPVVRQAVTLIGQNDSAENLIKVLCRTVGDIDDTVLLKRSQSIERYLYFKRKISSVDTTDKTQLKQLNDECIKNNISIGGSADVLAAAVMLNKLRNIFFNR